MCTGSIATQTRLIDALRDPRRFPHAARSVRVIETHISWILLAGRHAYKIKKALDLGFLDYLSLDARRHCCEEEIRLNRRLAPHIYLDVVAIGGRGDTPVFGELPAIEYAVRMRRFAAAQLMDRLLKLGRISPQHIDQLATLVARFHAGLPADTGLHGGAAAILSAARQNFAHLPALLTDAGDLARVDKLRAASEAEFTAREQQFEERRINGRIRECHGDLHLGNIALILDQLVPFDGIEFSPDLRWIDTMSELAFTVMDLLHHNRPDYAWRFLNANLEASGDYGGLAVLRYYLAYRATVRAKVGAIRAAQPGLSSRQRTQAVSICRRYLDLALHCLAERRPALILTHGLPGSGKTTFSQLALERLGAIRLRSDVERKRLFGLSALESSRTHAENIYTAAATRRTYHHLLKLARTILACGLPVIVDAAFLGRQERDDFHQLADELGIPFTLVTLHATAAELQARIVARHHDASEADLSVLSHMQAVQQALTPEELSSSVRYSTGESPDSPSNSAAWARLLPRHADSVRACPLVVHWGNR